nr:MAG TPA: hypothetical protein [Caudoviricetes sp.]
MVFTPNFSPSSVCVKPFRFRSSLTLSPIFVLPTSLFSGVLIITKNFLFVNKIILTIPSRGV